MAQPSVGASVAVQAPAVAAVGAPELVGSLPPPTCALLVSVPVVPALMLDINVKVLVPAAAIAVPLVQVIFCPAAVQLQFAACAPPSVTLPAAIVMPAGSTSTTVIVPLLEILPLLVTVRVYIVVPPAVTVALPLVFVNPRLTALTVSGPSIAQPSVGVPVPVHA